jgi:hypothetical protein
VVQYSVQEDWGTKIRSTVSRLKETFPQAQVLIFVSNKQIGAKSDNLKKEASDNNLYLDVRDRSWFVERANLDANRSAAAAELARVIVDPLLESKRVLTRSVSGISGQEAKTALVFLEMQWRDERAGKGLTKSSFEALVRGALHGTSNSRRMSRTEVHTRVAEFLPQHPPKQLVPYIDAALKRLAKSAVRHWQKEDEFTLSHEESERLKDTAAAIQILNEAFEADLRDILTATGAVSGEKQAHTLELVRRLIERYFLQRGEEFAASLARDADPPMNEADLISIAIEISPSERLAADRGNVELLLHAATTLLTNPSDATKEYLQLLSDGYTLFAFLEEAPDVQRVTKKLFTQGEIWLDTSVLLPVIAEQALPQSLRPFTVLFEQAKAATIRLFVTSGILEEIERHLNRCVAYTRVAAWEGRVPYVYARYALAGGTASAFGSWLEQFCGTHHPEEDIADYLTQRFGIEVRKASIPEELDPEVVSAVRDYWQRVQLRRRGMDEIVGMTAQRLAEHDTESYLAVLGQRQRDMGKSPLGYTSWWLTLDSAARNMPGELGSDVWRKIKHSPVMSIDFLLKYIGFGPSRDRVIHFGRGLAPVFAGPILESLPKDLLDVAQRVRTENSELPERIIQRRIRDALDRERIKVGRVQMAGLEGAPEAINDMF